MVNAIENNSIEAGKEELVEAAGIEPASASSPPKVTTCLAAPLY